MAVMVSQLVKFLLLKHEDLNLDSQPSLGKPRTVASNQHHNPTGADNGIFQKLAGQTNNQADLVNSMLSKRSFLNN